MHIHEKLLGASLLRLICINCEGRVYEAYSSILGRGPTPSTKLETVGLKRDTDFTNKKLFYGVRSH